MFSLTYLDLNIDAESFGIFDDNKASVKKEKKDIIQTPPPFDGFNYLLFSNKDETPSSESTTTGTISGSNPNVKPTKNLRAPDKHYNKLESEISSLKSELSEIKSLLVAQIKNK